jgi:hypothetical protein
MESRRCEGEDERDGADRQSGGSGDVFAVLHADNDLEDLVY